MKIAIIQQKADNGKIYHFPVTNEQGQLLEFTSPIEATKYIEENYDNNCEFYCIKNHLTVAEILGFSK